MGVFHNPLCKMFPDADVFNTWDTRKETLVALSFLHLTAIDTHDIPHVYKRGNKRLKSGRRDCFCTRNHSLLRKFSRRICLLHRDHNLAKA